MKITEHISELLYTQDCVIVPDFGGFVCNYAPARLNSVNHVFYPPTKKILFNKKLNKNDGLLANYISREEKIDFVTANKEIADFVGSCLQVLKKGNKLQLANIGTFYHDNENNIQFDPDTNTNYLLSSFGLAPVQLSPIKREGLAHKIDKKFVDRTSDPKQKRVVLKRILIPVLGSAILFFSIWIPVKTNVLNFNYSSFNPFKDNVEPKASVITTPPAVVANKEQPTKTTADDVIKNEMANKYNLSKETISALEENAATNKTFYIIGGSFEELENAKTLASRLKRKGFKSSILEKNEDGMHRVSYGSFSSKEEALKAILKIKKSQDSTAWILES